MSLLPDLFSYFRLARRRWWRLIQGELSLPASDSAISSRVIALAILLGIAFAWFNQLGVPLRASHSARVTADEPFYLLTTVSLIEDGDLDLANDYDLRRYRPYFDHPQELWHQSAPTADGRILSPHNLGTSLLILPAYVLGGLDGVKRFLGGLGGMTVALMALLAYRVTRDLRASLAAAALLGLSAPLFVYSTQIYPESPAALIVAACAWLLLGKQQGVSFPWKNAILLALGLNGLVWLGAKYGLVGSAMAVLGLFRLRPRARIALMALLIPSAISYVWFHVTTYGGLTPYVVNRLYHGESTISLIGLHLEMWNRLYRLAGLFIDGEFGLVRWAPFLLLILPALPLLLRRPGAVRWVLPVVFGTQLLVAVFFSITMRGWWFPGRMLIVALPLLAIPLAELLSLSRRHRWLAILAAALGLYALGITLALRQAASAEIIVLAVDPFSLPWAPFQMVADIFPIYTDYQASTWLITAAWALLGAVLVFLGRRLMLMDRKVGRQRGGARRQRIGQRISEWVGSTQRGSTHWTMSRLCSLVTQLAFLLPYCFIGSIHHSLIRCLFVLPSRTVPSARNATQRASSDAVSPPAEEAR